MGMQVAGYVLGDIAVAGGRVVEQEWSGIWGAQIEVPLPQLAAARWPDLTGLKVPRQVSVGLLLVGDSVAAFNSLLLAVCAAVETTNTVLLTRTIDTIYGPRVDTAYATYLGGCDPTMASHCAGRIMPRWQLLDSEWQQVS